MYNIDKSMFSKYKTIVIDPPWNQGKTGKRKARPNQGTTLDYPTLTKEELIKFPVNQLTQDNAFLFLWATNSRDKKTKEPILKIAFELIEHWGYTFYTMVTWDKRTGPCPFGPYQIVTEYILFCYKGKCIFKKEFFGKLKNIFVETPTNHSVKPDSFYQQIKIFTDSPRIDIFARQKRDGFDGWGDEFGKYEIDTKRKSNDQKQINVENYAYI